MRSCDYTIDRHKSNRTLAQITYSLRQNALTKKAPGVSGCLERAKAARRRQAPLIVISATRIDGETMLPSKRKSFATASIPANISLKFEAIVNSSTG